MGREAKSLLSRSVHSKGGNKNDINKNRHKGTKKKQQVKGNRKERRHCSRSHLTKYLSRDLTEVRGLGKGISASLSSRISVMLEMCYNSAIRNGSH